MNMQRTLTLKLQDGTIEHKIFKIRLFSQKYNKNLKANEIHSPLAAKIMVETPFKVYQYLIVQAIVKVDQDGNVDIWSNLDKRSTILESPLYNQWKLDEAIMIHKLLNQKSQFGLSVKEIIAFQEAKTILAIDRVMSLKIALNKAGGF